MSKRLNNVFASKCSKIYLLCSHVLDIFCLPDSRSYLMDRYGLDHEPIWHSLWLLFSMFLSDHDVDSLCTTTCFGRQDTCLLYRVGKFKNDLYILDTSPLTAVGREFLFRGTFKRVFGYI